MSQTKTKANELSLTKEQQKSLDACETTSGRMRYLHLQGWPDGAIARHLGKRPQHVWNVLHQDVKNPVDKF